MKQALQLLLLLFALACCTSACHRSKGFSTGPAATGDSLAFLVLGDWGKKGGAQQSLVADQMDIAGRRHHVRFIVTTGDNFYNAGVRDTTDPHWNASFEHIYNQQGHQLPWYPVLGNHDYGGNPGAQVQYSAISNRWRMPARFYALRQPVDGGHDVLLLFTDSSPFVDTYHGTGMSDLDRQDTAVQRNWIRTTLDTSRATWKIVVGHHPIYSAGPHGDTRELKERLLPLLEASGTDFYLSGHDHSLQYLFNPRGSVHYLVSGGGSEHTTVQPHPYARFAKAAAGFLVVTLYADRANFYFYNSFGKVLYRETIRK